MTDTTDIRWKQRLDNYRKAYKKLAIAAEKVNCVSNLERGSRDAIKKALAIGLINNPLWLENIIDRNRTSRNYDKSAANEIQHVVIQKYMPLFTDFLNVMERIEKEE